MYLKSCLQLVQKHCKLILNYKHSLAPTAFTRVRNYSLYEPDYLNCGKSEVPNYGTINIQIKGYDFPILESYQKCVHNIATSMDIEVEDGWATPAKHFKIHKYKPQSVILDTEYKLTVYERNIQVLEVPSTKAAVLVELLQAALPEGVALNLHEHQEEDEEIRYVPDFELNKLKTQLDSMGGSTIKKKH